MPGVICFRKGFIQAKRMQLLKILTIVKKLHVWFKRYYVQVIFVFEMFISRLVMRFLKKLRNVWKLSHVLGKCVDRSDF
jgi:hypothetical protein